MNETSVYEAFGILPEYTDLTGQAHRLETKTFLGILVALGYDPKEVSDPESILRKNSKSTSSRILEPIYFIPVNSQPGTIRIRWAKDQSIESLRFRIILEEGPTFDVRVREISTEENDADNLRLITISLLEPLPPGYHKLRLEGLPESYTPTGILESILIVHPETCYDWPDTWKRKGISLQLYSVRSPWNDGIGDFKDLLEIGLDCAQNGFSILGVNPLHALFPLEPEQRSPYSPSNRLFKNPLYIHLPWVFRDFGFHELESEYLLERGKAKLLELISDEHIDYAKISDFKMKFLRAIFQRFMESAPAENPETFSLFQTFTEAGGTLLFRHCLFDASRIIIEALKTSPLKQGQSGSDRLETEIDEKSRKLTNEVRFYQFIQWIAEKQFSQVADSLSNINISLYTDLAVGPDPGGSEVQIAGRIFSSGATIGSPPDEFSPNGQNWGILPLIPNRLKEDQYEHFIELLRANMPKNGILRIDHAAGLFRLFWIPNTGDTGGYVLYPWEDLLRILTLESQRNRCAVVAEDLGLVPVEIKKILSEFGIYLTKILYFEKHDSHQYSSPSHYQLRTVASINTHDLPTLKGYWNSEDIKERFRIGMLSWAEYETLLAERAGDKEMMLALMRKEGILIAHNGNGTQGPEFEEALFKLLTSANSKIRMLAMHDILGEYKQTNLPGTTNEYPNWKLRYSQFWRDHPFFNKTTNS
ncbi:4-alpha-glucanotransferase [Leptospira inadai serovar Lyme str. 10]|uniref:4-alpha-glucanotransferase n=2 Tax=Leptospira inadai serovar Lyme TaxID=293084 RepID=V6H9Z5_9LEPT|nr:4-alpha-glucanotransferase [Leptospira inadai]EQA35877.1 4-alpha-glucanotransferase [Leptospira inadai serovar Lyme str. 10]PNV76980.1 4-alpha-glucanotransferase [Leptospira inadai serovar Lyme]